MIEPLRYGGLADVPEEIAVCPECGGSLVAECAEWVADTGQPTECGIGVQCVKEEERLEEWEQSDDDIPLREVSHRWGQGEWQPVLDAVKRWAGATDDY